MANVKMFSYVVILRIDIG